MQRTGIRTARLGTLLVSLPLLVAGCALSGELGPYVDAAPARSDGSPYVDGGLVPTLEDEAVAGACYDGLDNDLDGAEDCEDSACAVNTLCCVGSSHPECCSAVEAFASSMAIPPSECDNVSVDMCNALDAFTPFGDGLPRIEAGTLVPQGGLGHGGVVLSQALDSRAGNVVLKAEVFVPPAANRCADCIDAAGIALVRQLPPLGQPAEIEVGMLVTGSRAQVLLYLHDEVVGRVDLEEGTSTLEIRTTVDGRAQFVTPTGATTTLEAGVLGPLLPVVIGRTDNRAGESAVGVRSAEVAVFPCDTPGALSRGVDAVFPASFSAFAPDHLGRLAIVRSGSEGARATRGVYELNGTLHVLGETGAGELAGVGGLEPGPVAIATPPSGAVGLFDPWLIEDGVTLFLYYAVETEDGHRHLERVAGLGGTFADFTGVSEVLAMPADLGDTSGPLAFDAPTVWKLDGSFRMIARARSLNGAAVLVSLISADGLTWSFAGTDLASSIVLEPEPNDLFAFDRDEVAAPALIVRTGVRGVQHLELYYAARRGSRWSIGVAVSTDGVEFRRVGALFAGDANGFDAVSVSSPAPLLRDDGVIDLFYRGTDGLHDAYGLAHPLTL